MNHKTPTWLFERQYALLLAALISLLLCYPLLRGLYEGRLLFDLLFIPVFLAAILVIFRQHRHRVLGLVLGLPLVLAASTNYVFPGLAPTVSRVGFHLLAALFFAFTVAMILGTLYREERVTADSVYGAFCGYLLVGLAFGHIYSLTEALAPGSFIDAKDLAVGQDEDLRHFLLTYFSFITLTTVGYGEITPASLPARGLVLVEAVIGQFYLVVLMAELIGKRMSHLNRSRE